VRGGIFEKKEKLTDIGFYWLSGILEIFYWTVLDVGWFCDTILDQSTSETKIEDKSLADNRRTAQFNIFGNYFSVRKNTGYM